MNLSEIPKTPFIRKGAVISPKSSLFKEGLINSYLAGAVLAGIKALNGIASTGVFLVAVFPIRRSDNEAQPQTIAEEAFGAVTERSAK